MDQRKGRFALQSRSAVIVISNDPTRTGRQRPLALELVMGTPLLRWMTHALACRGVERWLLVCQKNYLSEAKLCFPEGCELTVCEDREAGNPLHVFLSSSEEDETEVLVIIGACVCLPDDGSEVRSTCACQVRCDELMTALDEEDFSFSRFLLTRGGDCTQLAGVKSVNNRSELDRFADRIRSGALQILRDHGVQIWDEANCHVDPSANIGSGTVLMPGTVIRGASVIGGDCVIGPDTLLENVQLGSGCRINGSQLSDCSLGNDCTVGPYVCIRSGSRLESRVRVGSGSELSGVKLGEATRIGAICALHEVTSGRGCIFSSGVICTDGPVRMEEEVEIGGGVTISGPVTIGRGASVSAGTVLIRDVPPQALVTARARQSVRRDRTK